MRFALALGVAPLILAGAFGFGCGEEFSSDDDGASAGEGNRSGNASGGTRAGPGGEAGEATGGTTGGTDPGGGGSQGGTEQGGSSGEGGQGGTSQGGTSGSGAGGAGDGGGGSGARGGAGGSGGNAGASGGIAGGGIGGASGSGGAVAGTGGTGGGPVAIMPSCSGMVGNECQGMSCCESPVVSGGTFAQGEPDAFQSTVSSFRLDRFEVVVGRFRRFTAAYEAWRIAGNPLAGAGAHPQIANSGWDTAWAASLPASAAALKSIVKCNMDYGTWRDDASAGGETLPMNCISWYEAFAFCIWDGGRLPTEAEWEYAAAGGNNDYLYPWGSTPVPDNLDGSYAIYNCLGDGVTGCAPADIRPVGSKPLGQGRYLQRDLSGSLFEWVLDVFGAYPTSERTNFANLSDSNFRVARGGNWSSTGADIRAATRHNRDAADRYYGIYGIRCARTP